MTDSQFALVFDATRPELALEQLCNDEERAIGRALFWGRAGARKVDEIAAAAGVPPRQAQDLIQHLLFEHGWPIGTSMSEPFGNYLIDTAEELDQTVELLRSRGISNLARAAALKRMSLEQYMSFVQERLKLSTQ